MRVSLWVAVPCAVAAAAVYGAATAVQHAAAARTAGAGVRGLATLLRDPRWLLSVGGDGLGLLLQVIALATGPVVLIQPLLVLALPAALVVGWLLGGPRPRRADVLAVGAILAALAVFFVLVGDPGTGTPLRVAPTVIAATVCLTAISVAIAVRGRSPLRAALLGAAAGVGFALAGVLINAVALDVDDHGWAGLVTDRGVTALAALLVVGVTAVVATQLSFQLGALGASFPANESVAPVAAVALGAVLLHEHVPATPAHLLTYLLCAAAIAMATVRLARAQT